MFYKKINLLIILSFLTSCAVNYNYPEVKQAELQSSYGIWQYNNCQLTTNRAGVKATLTDVFADDGARLTLQFEDYLQSNPFVNIIGLEGYDLQTTGARGFYSIEIPAGVVEQARMYLDQAFLQVRYRKIRKDYDTRAILPLEGLPEGMLYVQKNCS